MAQEVTEVTITVNRATKKGVVSGDAIHIRDEAVQLTLVNVTTDDIAAGLVFTIYKGSTEFATCSTWTANDDGDAVGTLNTNTVAFDAIFADASDQARKWFSYKIYTLDQLIPTCSDRLMVENFTGNVEGTPTLISSPADILDTLNTDIETLQGQFVVLQAAYEAADAALDAKITALDAAYRAADAGLTAAIGAAVTAHNISGSAHDDIRLAVAICGTGIYVQFTGAGQDDKWRKVVPAMNEYGEYLMTVQQTPTYTLDTETRTWEEDA